MSQKTASLRNAGISVVALFVITIGGFFIFTNNSIENDVNFLTDLESNAFGSEGDVACIEKVSEWKEVIGDYQGLISHAQEEASGYRQLYDKARGSKKNKWGTKLEELNRDVVIYRNAIYRYSGFIDRCEKEVSTQ